MLSLYKINEEQIGYYIIVFNLHCVFINFDLCTKTECIEYINTKLGYPILNNHHCIHMII